MIKLALAIGFLAVFGLIGYIATVLLIDFLKTKNKQNEN